MIKMIHMYVFVISHSSQSFKTYPIQTAKIFYMEHHVSHRIVKVSSNLMVNGFGDVRYSRTIPVQDRV